MNSSDLPPESHVVFREQLPLSGAYVAPRTSTEEKLTEIWRSVLSMDRVGVEDDYFDLGGDSLLATAIFSQIRQSFHVALPAAALVETPKIAQLAAKIETLQLAQAMKNPQERSG